MKKKFDKQRYLLNKSKNSPIHIMINSMILQFEAPKPLNVVFDIRPRRLSTVSEWYAYLNRLNSRSEVEISFMQVTVHLTKNVKLRDQEYIKQRVPSGINLIIKDMDNPLKHKKGYCNIFRCQDGVKHVVKENKMSFTFNIDRK